MINYLKTLWKNILTFSLKSKILVGAIVFFYVIVSLSCIIQINYTSTTPGSANRIESFIKVESDNPVGEIYTLSVFEYRQVSLLQYVLSLLNKETALSDFDPETALSSREQQTQGEIMKEVSVRNSIILAYTEANKYDSAITIEYQFDGMIVHTIYPETDPVIQLGDIITAINGVQLISEAHFYELVAPIMENINQMTLPMTIKRGETTLNIEPEIKIITDESNIERRVIGISIYAYHTIISTNPTYTEGVSFVIGPSGGLMQTIAVYNAITSKDITNGLKLMGTGTISIDGVVGTIGGVQQKIITAHLYGADLFFVPTNNYNDALAQYEKLKNPSYPTPVAVDTFSEAIAYLEGLGD